MISKLLKLLLLIYAIAGTIRCYAQQDSGKICLTGPEFDYYARALVERNNLQEDTADLRGAVSELRLGIVAKDDMLRQDSLIFIQKDQITMVQGQALQVAADDLSKEKRWKVFWRTSAIVCAAVAAVLLTR